MPGRQLHFTAFIYPAGYHESAWRVVPADPRSVLALPYYVELARIAEPGLLDAMFMADNIVDRRVPRRVHAADAVRPSRAAVARWPRVTARIGLIATGSTTYTRAVGARAALRDARLPQRRPRRLEHRHDALGADRGQLRRLRASVATPQRYEHAERVRRGRAARVWDGWEDDAVVGSKQAGVWADRAKLHAPRFHGEHYQVAGILPFPRSPQGYPVLVQAGSSPAGVDLAARYAELVFTRQPTLAAAIAFREPPARAGGGARTLARPRPRAAGAGLHARRRPRRRRRRASGELEELASPEFRWRNMLWMIGLDPDGPFDPDGPLPDELVHGPPPSSGAEPVFAARAAERMPLRELARRHAGMPNEPDLRRHARAARGVHRGVVARGCRRRLHADGEHAARRARRRRRPRRCRSCAAAACSARSTTGPRCASTSACRGRATATPPPDQPGQPRTIPQATSRAVGADPHGSPPVLPRSRQPSPRRRMKRSGPSWMPKWWPL